MSSTISQIQLEILSLDDGFDPSQFSSDVKQRVKQLRVEVADTAQIGRLLQYDMEVLETRVFNRYASSEAKATGSVQQEAEPRPIQIDKTSLQLHGKFLSMLQSKTKSLADIAHSCNLAELDQFLDIVSSNIYGNQFNQHEEQLWLLTFLQVLARQYESTPQLSSMLRSNSAAPRMMTAFAQRIPGQSYLREVLSPVLDKVLSSDENLDISPLSIYYELKDAGEVSPHQTFNIHSAEDHEDYHRINAIAERRYEKLKELVTLLLQTIFSSVDRVPYGMRWMTKQIRILARVRFEDASEQQVSSLLVGTFFLRFINPAILFPAKYCEYDSPLTGTAKRNSTMLAKVVQMIANKTSHNKKIFTVDMKAFLDSFHDQIETFLEKLCDVGDFFHHEQLDHYLSFVSSANQILMKPKQLEFVKAMIVKYLPDSNELKPMIAELEDLGDSDTAVRFSLPYDVQGVWWPLYFEASQKLIGFLVTKSVLVDGYWTNQSSTNLSPEEIMTSAAATIKASAYNRAKAAFESIKAHEELLSILLDEVHLELLRLGSYPSHLNQEELKLEHALSVVNYRNEYLQTQIQFLQTYLRGHKRSSKPQSPITSIILSPNEMHTNKVLQYWTFEPHLWPMLYFQLRKTGDCFTLSLHFRERLPPLIIVTFTIPTLLTLEEDVINLRCLKLARDPLINMLQSRFV